MYTSQNILRDREIREANRTDRFTITKPAIIAEVYTLSIFEISLISAFLRPSVSLWFKSPSLLRCGSLLRSTFSSQVPDFTFFTPKNSFHAPRFVQINVQLRAARAFQ